MDAVDGEFELLATSVERTAAVQKAEVQRFLDSAPRDRVVGRAEASGDAEPRRGAALARHLAAAYDAVAAHAVRRREDYGQLPDAASKKGAVTEMRQLVAGARNLHRSLAWLDAARVPPLDLGTRYFVDFIAANVVDPRAEVTVVAGERSYGKVTNPLSPVFALSGSAVTQDELAIVIFVPRREQDSGLLHPLIVHELAHAADDQHGLVVQVLEALGDTQALTERMEAAAAQAGEDPSVAAQELAARLVAWIEEAVCDALAAQILGPTYLYAFMAIVGTSNLDAAGDEHPPTRARIRLLLDQLHDLGWDDLLAGASPAIEAWFRAAAEQRPSYPDPSDAFCLEAVDLLAPHIHRVVGAHVGPLSFAADDLGNEAKEVMMLLSAGIPPSQGLEGGPISRASIILGSWLFAVAAEGGDLAALARASGVPELSRLLPKALHDVALLEAWRREA